MDTLRARLLAFRAWFQNLDAARRFWFLGIAGLGLAGLIVAFEVATYVPMVPLFEQRLDSATGKEVLEHLQAADIKYEIERGTDRILVPDAARDQLRMELSGSGMIDAKGVGLELFDDNRFGSTKFVEHIRYVRGLQGEIERQINGFDAVRGSKVLLSMPEESLFTEEAVDPSASVYLDLKSGAMLSAAEGSRIATLVANAVPRLTADAVAILDSDMRVIHAASENSGDAAAASSLAGLKRDYEGYYKREIERILERVVGPGKVVARVNVELENSQQYTRERQLHGDGAVAISVQTEEKSNIGRTNGGVAGTGANLRDVREANGGNGAGQESTSSTERGNYDVPETLREQSSLPGGVKSVTAAVLVDGSWVEATVTEGEAPAEGAAPADKVYTARTEDELNSYKSLVASALGVQAASVTVINQQFAKVELTPSTPSTLTLIDDPRIKSYLRYGFAFAALLLTFGFIVRPVMNNVLVEPESETSQSAPAQLPEPEGDEGQTTDPVNAQADALAELIARLGSGQTLISRQDISNLVSADPTHSVVTLQAWLHEDEA